MPTDVERRRVLVAARSDAGPALRQLFASEPLTAWETVEADTFEQTRFLLQHTALDVLLIDEGLCAAEGMDGLTWLARERETPMVFLAADEADLLRAAYEHGASVCVSRGLSLGHPALLGAALRRAAQAADVLRAHSRRDDMLLHCRRQIDRLVTMLWRSVPTEHEQHWCSQRHVLMRLAEEIARSARHGGPLTVAVGELQASESEQVPVDLTEWITERIASTKRRCDVAGQYGMHGFLLLMVNTGREGGVSCCQRLRKALEEAIPAAEGPRGPLRACFGIASLSGETRSSQSLLSSAEVALDAAKASPSDPIIAS
ncbi:MAG TPA: diguanylate cyclase [Gemmataceae bacterium]|nr:diguanylate cyclase [Gemmataceae bacterium]